MFGDSHRIDLDRTLAYRLAPCAVLLVLSVFVHWTSVMQPGRPFYVDSNLPLTYADFAGRYFSAWNANTGHLNFAQIMRLPYVAPLYLVFHTFGIDVTWFVTVLFWLPTFLGMAAGYAAFRGLLGDRSAGAAPGLDATRWWAPEAAAARRLVAVCLLLGVAYGLGPWITKHFHHYYFRVSYAVLPLAFLAFVRYVRGGPRRYLVFAAIAATLVALNPHFLVYFFLLAGAFALFDGALSGRLVRTVSRAGLVVGTFLALSSFWILPFLFVAFQGESVVGYNVGERIVSLSSRRSTPVNLFSLMGGYWPAILERPYWLFDPIEHYQLTFLAIPVAAVAGLVASDRDDRLALFAGTVAVVTLALATGYRYGGPVAAVYDLILELPFHGVLRAPDRLTSLLPLLYGYLIGRAVLDADRRTLRYGAVALLVVVCLAALLVNLHVVTSALSPAVLPADHERVVEADYEDAFVAPPRPLSGYNPDWKFSRESGIVDSWDTHLYARPDTRQHAFNYYVFELLDRGRTDAALAVLRKTGANHVVVRRDARNRRGIPPSHELIDTLDGALERVDAGPNLVVYDLDGHDRPFRVVRPVEAPRDVDAARPLATRPAAYPTFRSAEPDEALAERLDADRRFHPSNAFRRLNQRDTLSRPPTYAGARVTGERRLDTAGSEGSLVIRATPLSRQAEVVRETESGRSIHKFPSGIDRLVVPLDGSERAVTLRGPVYVEDVTVTGEDRDRSPTPVNATHRAGGTVTPDRTTVTLEPAASAVIARAEVSPGGGFWQVSYDLADPVDGPLSVNATVTAREGGDRVGVVLLTDAGDAILYGTGERLDRGTQELSVHLPSPAAGGVDRIQLAVLPADGTVDNRVMVHDLGVAERPDSERRAPSRPVCDVESTAYRCEGAAEIVDVDRQSPTRYDLTVGSSAPYALQFGDSYDSLWAAEVSGPSGTERYGARPLYLATNGFWIDEVGRHTVTVRYRPQRWYEYGLALSGLSALACGFVLWSGRRRRTDRDATGPLARRVGRARRAVAATTSRLTRGILP